MKKIGCVAFVVLTLLAQSAFSQAMKEEPLVVLGFSIEITESGGNAINLQAVTEQSKMRCGREGATALKIPLKKRLTKAQLAAFKNKGLSKITVRDKNETLVFQVTKFMRYSKKGKSKSVTVGISSCKRSIR